MKYVNRFLGLFEEAEGWGLAGRPFRFSLSEAFTQRGDMH